MRRKSLCSAPGRGLAPRALCLTEKACSVPFHRHGTRTGPQSAPLRVPATVATINLVPFRTPNSRDGGLERRT